ISMEEARAPMGAHKQVHIRRISENPNVAARWEKTHGRLPTEEDVVAMFEAFVPLQLACLADYAELIPGTLEFVAAARQRGLKIGSTTGYTVEMMDLLGREAARRGYEPDHSVSSAEVPEGRPAPWMCLENAKHLGVYPLEAMVKVDDTVPGIEEGINAGMWTVGLAKSGNEIGLTEREIEALSADELERRLARAYTRMQRAGADYIIDGIWDLLPCLDDIEARLARGERPQHG
ncbi:MAG: phosphonoacetaldehyde hydrolase, partial [Vicinamibacterales bacterium]|nr:phosphonoacetaldehyde hydrolase [Vicinamibacterales bacterium]